MAITYYMLQIPSALLFILIVCFGALFAGSLTFLFQKFINVKVLRSHNEVTGFLFLAIASFYALFLNFIILIVWEQLNETKGNVSKEGSFAIALYHDIKYYPDTVDSKPLLTAYMDFVYNVVDDEFPKMEHMQSSKKTLESFSHVYFSMEHLNPKTPKHVQLVGEMFRHLNELAVYRGLRISSMETEISPFMWFPMILGGVITLFCSMLLDIEHLKIHTLLISLLGAFIGIFFFTIIVLDHPYSGSSGLKPKSYREIFTLEQWTQK